MTKSLKHAYSTSSGLVHVYIYKCLRNEIKFQGSNSMYLILSETHHCMVVMVTGRFAYKSFCLQVDSPTSRSFRLHDRSRFAYTIWVDSPTFKSIRLHLRLTSKYLIDKEVYSNYSNVLWKSIPERLKVQFVTHSCFVMRANPDREFFFLLSYVRISSCGDNNVGAITCFLHTSCYKGHKETAVSE